MEPKNYYKNYYKILNVNRDADKKEIKQAYRKLAKVYHPDTNPANKETLNEKFKEIKEAFDVLYDDDLRLKYNITYDEIFGSRKKKSSEEQFAEIIPKPKKESYRPPSASTIVTSVKLNLYWIVPIACLLFIFVIFIIFRLEIHTTQRKRYNKVISVINTSSYSAAIEEINNLVISFNKGKKLLSEQKITELLQKCKAIHPDVFAMREDEFSLKKAISEYDKMILHLENDIRTAKNIRSERLSAVLEGHYYKDKKEKIISTFTSRLNYYRKKRRDTEKKLMKLWLKNQSISSIKNKIEDPDNLYQLALESEGEEKEKLLEKVISQYKRLKDYYYNKCKETEEIIGLADPLARLPQCDYPKWEYPGISCVRVNEEYLTQLKKYTKKLREAEDELARISGSMKNVSEAKGLIGGGSSQYKNILLEEEGIEDARNKRHIYKSGRSNFTVERIHDLEEIHPVGTPLRICWQTGTPGGHCTGGYASFYISSDGRNWTHIGSEYYPERKGEDDIIHTSLFNPNHSFRYVKVSIPNNYCDFSSAEVNWFDYEANKLVMKDRVMRKVVLEHCPFCNKLKDKDEIVCSQCGYEYECAICEKKRDPLDEKVCSKCGYEYKK